MKVKTALLISILLVFTSVISNAQDGVGIGTNSPDQSAVLEVASSSTPKGLLVPRLTLLDRDNIASPANGLIIYNTSQSAFNYYDGTDWIRLIVAPAQINLDMNNRRITNLAEGTSNTDAVNRNQLNTTDSNNLDRDGTDPMTGNLNMNNNRIRNLANGTVSTDALTLGQLENRVNNLSVKVVEIGDWNMDFNPNVSVRHGLPDYEKIRHVSAVIRSDSDVGGANPSIFPLTGYTSNGQEISGAVRAWNATFISLSRLVLGEFDSPDFNATSYNRGWVFITYEE